jgi:hypothetical protein
LNEVADDQLDGAFGDTDPSRDVPHPGLGSSARQISMCPWFESNVHPSSFTPAVCRSAAIRADRYEDSGPPRAGVRLRVATTRTHTAGASYPRSAPPVRRQIGNDDLTSAHPSHPTALAETSRRHSGGLRCSTRPARADRNVSKLTDASARASRARWLIHSSVVGPARARPAERRPSR